MRYALLALLLTGCANTAFRDAPPPVDWGTGNLSDNRQENYADFQPLSDRASLGYYYRFAYDPNFRHTPSKIEEVVHQRMFLYLRYNF